MFTVAKLPVATLSRALASSAYLDCQQFMQKPHLKPPV